MSVSSGTIMFLSETVANYEEREDRKMAREGRPCPSLKLRDKRGEINGGEEKK